VRADTDTLATLPEREYASGLAEVIKYGALGDAAFFGWLETNMPLLRARESSSLAKAIHRSCEIKARIVAEDEREAGVRALLNLGHTFGHAIETVSGYGAWLHGEAVAAGMVMAARLSVRLGKLAATDADRIEALLQRAGLPVKPPAIPRQSWLDAMGRDKKNDAGRITLLVLDALGRANVDRNVPLAELESLLVES
jgi:3-dehydroquinate synthase